MAQEGLRGSKCSEKRVGGLGVGVSTRTVELRGLGTCVFGSCASRTAVCHQRFTGPSPPAPLRTKLATNLSDEQQMSRHGSKTLSSAQRPRIRNTHITAAGRTETLTRRDERILLCGEMWICGRLPCSSACLMGVCVGRTEREAAARVDRLIDGRPLRAQESYSVSMPVAINALSHSCAYVRAQASALTTGTMENKEWPF